MEVDEKRASTHAVAGVTEGTTYCSKSALGDRALGLFFSPWDETDSPTYKFCSYDNSRGEPNACKELEFATTNVDAKWFYVYSGYSYDKEESYNAFYSADTYKATTNPQLTHNSPPEMLSF